MKITPLLIALICFFATACDGDRGRTGNAGVNGTDGSNGIDGTNGTSGTNGISGANGADGTDGADGQDGVPGLSFAGNAPLDVQLFGRTVATDENTAVGNGGTDEFTALVDRALIDAERRLSH